MGAHSRPVAQRALSEGKVLSAVGPPRLWGPSFPSLDPLGLLTHAVIVTFRLSRLPGIFTIPLNFNS